MRGLRSDARNVGYANTWLRAPDEVYGAAGFDSSGIVWS